MIRDALRDPLRDLLGFRVLGLRFSDLPVLDYVLLCLCPQARLAKESGTVLLVLEWNREGASRQKPPGNAQVPPPPKKKVTGVNKHPKRDPKP